MPSSDSFVMSLQSQIKLARQKLKKLQPEHDHRKQLLEKAESEYEAASRAVANSGYVFASSRDNYARSRRLNSRNIDSLKYELGASGKLSIVSARRQIKSAKGQHRSAYYNANADLRELRRCRRALYGAREDFQEIQRSYMATLALIESLSIALGGRLDQLEELKRRNREIAFKAGVASQFLDEVLVKHDRELGLYNIYFGGEGRPDGPGHGHYTVAEDLRAHLYRREPGAKRGGDNFINSYIDVRRRFLLNGSTKPIDKESA